MTVFVVNLVGHDKNLRDTGRYGQLCILSDKFSFPDEVDDEGRLSHHFRSQLDAGVRRYDPSSDFVLPLGDMAQVSYFMAQLGARAERERWTLPIRILRFDRIEKAYYVVTIGGSHAHEVQEPDRRSDS